MQIIDMKTIYSLLFMLLTISVSAQSVYYVNQSTGNDAFDGMSATVNGQEGPKQTISAALLSLSDGDVLSIEGGAYAEDIVISKTIQLVKTGASAIALNSCTFTFGARLMMPAPAPSAFDVDLVTINAGSSINDGINLVSEMGALIVNAGDYEESVFLTKSFNLVAIDNPSVSNLILSGTGIKVILEGTLEISETLQFNRPEGGRIELSNGYLVVRPGATMTAGNGMSYAITSGSGKLLSALNTSTVIFPVGTEDVYAPVTVSGVTTDELLAVSVRPAGNPLSFNPDLPLQVNSHIRLEWTFSSTISGNANVRFDYNGTVEPSNWNEVPARVVAKTTANVFTTMSNSTIGESFASADVNSLDGVLAIYSDFPNSIPTAEALTGIVLYPNPFADVLQVNFTSDLNEAVNVQVADLTGRILAQRQLVTTSSTTTLSLNASDFGAAGLYLVSFTTASGRTTQRVIKQ